MFSLSCLYVRKFFDENKLIARYWPKNLFRIQWPTWPTLAAFFAYVPGAKFDLGGEVCFGNSNPWVAEEKRCAGGDIVFASSTFPIFPPAGYSVLPFFVGDVRKKSERLRCCRISEIIYRVFRFFHYRCVSLSIKLDTKWHEAIAVVLRAPILGGSARARELGFFQFPLCFVTRQFLPFWVFVSMDQF